MCVRMLPTWHLPSSLAQLISARGYIVVGPSPSPLVPLPQLQFEGNTVECAATTLGGRRREFLDFFQYAPAA
jgi:hypothetical protein